MILKNSVQKQSEKAVSALSRIVDDLLLANAEADVIIERQEREMEALAASTSKLIAQKERNIAISEKIQELLGVHS